ncbi:DNA lyase-like protein [Calycina marina]|uniref:DNA-(apurinic or apyrimidinic site) endonuclease 2 n=1 Tax=Calycina marina TaxID=1763456 RepID=A0A9P8CHL2_9HELO|nr:DNA lyase-like protein [Calycina marina]
MDRVGGLRITTWNVNGIRNPFGYQPWSGDRKFSTMFDILEADIVVIQETKIQRKDLRDDMVLVPGWDVYFSLPKHKKGYSGVAIYTRSSVCAPIRAEEGITGVLTPPNSTTSFRDLPVEQQVGGYPSITQMSECEVDATTLDSEGRCVILEFPAFVLIGVYNPANRDESRDEFRIGFLNALDARVRNLAAAGKRVFLTGDLNIIRDEIDTANAAEQLKKNGMTIEQYISTPARRMFNQLLLGGRVIGKRDEGREHAVMWDICRLFHPTRKGMFTCWEQKINARPGNFGSRIDYVLCSYDWDDWFCESDIQEGLVGSDHCPVYAVLKQKVEVDGEEVDIRDIMSAGMFKDGVRKREWTSKDLLPTSARLIPEFDRRRSIKDMFTKKPQLATSASSLDTTHMHGPSEERTVVPENNATTSSVQRKPILPKSEAASTQLKEETDVQQFASTSKRERETTVASVRPSKKSKTSSSISKPQSGKGQSSLTGFFKPKTPQATDKFRPAPSSTSETGTISLSDSGPPTPSRVSAVSSSKQLTSPQKPFVLAEQKTVVDPIVAKEGWSKILRKRLAPRCDHSEPCMTKKTIKPGENCGRSFYMCSRPLGPSGAKEKNTQWRCGTFIWSSDWTGDDT